MDNFKELIDEKFLSLQKQMDIQFNNIQKTLTSIEEQTKRTNGRLLEAEKKLQTLELSDATHSLRCPQNSKFKEFGDDIKDMKKGMEDINFFVRNPKLGLAIIVVSVIVTLFSYFSVYNYIQNNKTAHKIEMTK